MAAAVLVLVLVVVCVCVHAYICAQARGGGRVGDTKHCLIFDKQ